MRKFEKMNEKINEKMMKKKTSDVLLRKAEAAKFLSVSALILL